MTDVGKIKFGVEVDADDLSAQLGEAVRSAIAPALDKLQAKLQKVQREYDKTATAGGKSGGKQVAALIAVERQADKTAAALARARAAAFAPGGGAASARDTAATDRQTRATGGLANAKRNASTAQGELNEAISVFGRRSPQAAAAARNLSRAEGSLTSELLRAAAASRTATDSRIHDHQRLAREAEESAARQRAASLASGGIGGGGGSPGRIGRRGGALGFLTSPVGLNTIAVGVGAIPAALTGVTNLVGAVQQLGQAGLVIPGIFAAAGASIGTAVLGFHGIADATKAMNEALKSGDPKDLKKAEEAMKGMAPAGQELAKVLAGMNQGSLKEFRQNIQQRTLEGFAGEVKELSNKALPHLDKGLGGIADSWRGTLKTLTGSLGSDRNLSLMDQIFGNTAEGQKRANAAIDPLIHGLGTLAKEGSNFLPRLGDGLAKVTTRFETWVTKNAANGNMFRWIDEGLNGLRAFGNAILNVVQTITGLTKAAGQLTGSLSGDGGFLGWLEKATGQMNKFVNSAEGQAKLGKFFRDGTGDMKSLGTILADIWEILGHIFEGFAQWSKVILPIVGALGHVVSALGEIPGLLEAIVVGFLAWRTLGPIITGLTTKLGAMGAASAAAGGAAGGRGGGIRGAIRNSSGGLGIAAGGALAAAGSQGIGSDSDVGKGLGLAGMAAGGALIGASFGPIGAAVGAVGGTALGIYQLIGDAAKKSADEAADAAAKHSAALASMADTMRDTAAAQANLNEALVKSGGALDSISGSAVAGSVQASLKALRDDMNPADVQKFDKALADLGLTETTLAGQVTGSQQTFDALVGTLQKMGPAGQLMASTLIGARDTIMGASDAARDAAPLYQNLAAALGVDVTQAAANAKTAIQGLPENVPIDVKSPNGVATLKMLQDMKVAVTTLPNGTIGVDAPLAPEVLKALQAIGLQMTTINGTPVIVKGNADDLVRIKAELDAFLAQPATKIVNLVTGQTPGRFEAPPSGGDGFSSITQPKALGGPVYGGIPGRDSVPALLMPGEHVLTTADVSALGGQAGVYAMRQALHFATGGEVPGGTNPIPMPTPDNELGVLIQIRDLLAGKGGAASNPLAATAANTATAATAAKNGSAAGGLGPFGTPLKKRGDPAYEMAAAAIQALGGDPEKWIGMDPSTYVPPALAGGVGLPGAMGGSVNFAQQAAALAAFAKSGNLADVTGLGLNANSPVITALTSARNKKKGMSDADIAALVDTVLNGGGYTGTLDAQNTPIVKSLTRYRDQLLKGQGIAPTSARGAAAVASSVGVPMTGLPSAVDPISAYAQAHSGGQYSWGASDLSKGLSDCSGAVSDLVEIITKGQADSGRLFDTHSAAGVLTAAGAVPGAVPGALQIGWSDEHMRATLPNGVNFESGGGTGQGATYGGAAKGAAGLPNIMSLPVGGVPLGAGMTGTGLGAAGGQGTPVFVTNWPGGNGLPPGVGQILGAGLSAAGQSAGTVATDFTSAISQIGKTTNRKPNASIDQLLNENNPLALAAMAGLNVQDFTRQGGSGADVQKNDQKYDASGRLISDTSSIADRTFTDLNAQLSAMREQLVDVIQQTNEKLQDSALEPVIKAGMQSALEGLKDSVSNAIGTALGNAAAPPIADAVSSAVSSLPIDNSGAGNTGGALAGAIPLPGMADGGPISGGVAGVDSVPALLMPGEFVLNTGDVARMGGTHGVEAARRKGFRHFASGGNVNDVVGAEFFGVAGVPILGAIMNLIIGVLLKVVGVEIEARNTMTELTDEFRGFRGDAFKAFDATGRLLNDTSALMDRTSSSTEAAAEERIRILKIVIEAVIKYIIEKVIVPITKAVANAAIQAGASAAGAAVNTQAPGAGGIVSSLISSAGQAGVDIAAEVGTDFALALSSQLINLTAEGLQSAAPGIVNSLFGGGLLTALFDPAGGFMSALFGGIMGLFSALFGGLFGGASTLIPGLPFDNGGLARGKGVMLKDVDADELVLNPGQTDLFTRFVRALENGGFGGSNSTHVSAPITIVGGGRETADQVENRLLKLMP